MFNYLSFRHLWNRINGKKNRISITGDVDKIRNLRERVNTIYIPRFKNNTDFYYYVYSIYKKFLPEPRFFVPAEVSGGWLNRYLLRKCGGYIIHRSKSGNLLYRECVIQYISTLISHGVPLLYFPENEPEKNSVISPLNEYFFELLNSIMYQESTEIVLIPAQITYSNKLNESDDIPVFSEPAVINFSSPLFLSDFTKQIHSEISVHSMIRELWISDEIILPQHIICGILQQKNYILKAAKLKKYIERFISENNLPVPYNSKHILNNGLKFLLKNDIIQKKNDYLLGAKIDIISRYSEIIKTNNLENQ